MENENVVGKEIMALSGKIVKKILKDKQQETKTLNNSQSRILAYIIENGKKDVFLRDIEKAFMIRRATISKILKSLEEYGYITRESVVSDARLKKIVPTQKAFILHKQMQYGMREKDMSMVNGIDKNDLKTFLDVIHKISENLDCQ
ncbi:MAG: MarR family transcriptional regulator [Clostridia bacterium]|nr:MarR family transcriptional regulator [Clostridia bacterium]